MIKRRFYKLEHGDRDAPSESSSSSDDSELEAAATEDEEEYEYEEEDDNDTKEEDDVARLTGGNESSSGYESEDSSAHEVNPDSSVVGLPSSDEDVTTLKDTKISGETHLLEKGIADLDNARNNFMPEEDDIPRDALDYVLKCKSVFKCRICPRIVCLTVQTLNAHLKSKRHARSEKLLKEGRLKLMLTEDGRIDGEIHPEEDSPIGGQNPSASKKKSKGLKRQHKGKKFNKNEENFLPVDGATDSRKNQSKKRQKNK
ncbi:uncharacterized protein [Nicotiana tomentosiformis]|uniref:Uncharacterized protein isoform X1 n=1 Tax=Nicotiana tabacum TaxID=4097 RepID=A0A1S3Y1A2_TOBAC|nr:uncharacterized protein LOC104095776 isoform X2 [Nicotiana tomentosiformis]XP_016445771.1 PREDICTED: uncharacterized protein LOC107770954 isoform X1 [Nicotiana tabacum]XP_016445777.1 PREDICTED: uncharacterized protein LOC107770954 isoform X1 [Nicotiana tabacum]